jgi:transcriptional regulator with XRE-family HTH domain
MSRPALTARQRLQGQRLARSLRRSREASGRSAEEVARKAKVSVETVRSIESERTPNPGFLTVVYLAVELSLDLNELAAKATRRR